MSKHSTLARNYFESGYNCAQSVFCAFSDVTGFDLNTSARIASSFGGGLGRLREVCGCVSAAAMVLGYVKGYDTPGDDLIKKDHYKLIREYTEVFKARANKPSYNCRVLLSDVLITTGDMPEARTPDYYQRRPCPALMEMAAELLDEFLGIE